MFVKIVATYCMEHKRSGQLLKCLAENRQFLSSTRAVFDGGYLIELGEACIVFLFSRGLIFSL
jgi:hypothetical protein